VWSIEELEILKKHYPDDGFRACGPLLFNKSRGAVNSMAFKLGIKVNPEAVKKIHEKMGIENLNHKNGNENNNWKGGARDRKEYKRKTKEKYPERDKARDMVRVAIKNGLIKRTPCVICGDIKSEAHHEDYSKPLEVVFLCRKHHVEADKIRRSKWPTV